jgi:hypothetical protein
MYLFCTVIWVYVPDEIAEFTYNDTFSVNAKRFKHEKGENERYCLPTQVTSLKIYENSEEKAKYSKSPK